MIFRTIATVATLLLCFTIPFVAAICADGLRLARTWRRASLCAAIAQRERERRAAR